MWDSPADCEFNLEFESGMLVIKSEELLRQPINGEIRKIHLFYYPYTAQLMGIRFYDLDDKCIYESTCKGGLFYDKHEILLNKGEKIIGFQSREYEPGTAWHFDF